MGIELDGADGNAKPPRQYSFSIRQLSDILGKPRELIAKRVAEANISPTSKRRGHPLYRSSDVAAVVFGEAFEGEFADPNRMQPTDRSAWFQSEAKRLDVETRSRQLIPVAEFETELAKMTKDLVQFLETLPDVLERDVTLSPEQIERMHELIASHRQGLYEKIVSDEETSASD